MSGEEGGKGIDGGAEHRQSRRLTSADEEEEDEEEDGGLTISWSLAMRGCSR